MRLILRSELAMHITLNVMLVVFLVCVCRAAGTPRASSQASKARIRTGPLAPDEPSLVCLFDVVCGGFGSHVCSSMQTS